MTAKSKANQRLVDAVDKMDIEEARKALAEGADVNAFFLNDSDSMISHAISERNEAMARLLIEGGKDKQAQTRLLEVTWSPALTELLLELGADVRTAKGGRIPVVYKWVQEGHPDTLPILVAAGADVNATYHSGASHYSPLMRATWSLDVDKVRQLVAAGATYETRSGDRMDLMRFLVRENREASERLRGMIRALTAIGFSVNRVYPDGKTIGHLAMNNRGPETLQIFLEEGLDLSLQNSAGLSVEYVACKKKDPGFRSMIAAFKARAAIASVLSHSGSPAP